MASLTVSYQNSSCAWINAFTASPNNGHVCLSESIYMHLKIEDRSARTHKIEIIFSRAAEQTTPLLKLASGELPFKKIKPTVEINQKEIKDTYTIDLNTTEETRLLLKVTPSNQERLKGKKTVMTVACAGQRLLRRFVKQEKPKFAQASKKNPTGIYRESPLAINHYCRLGSSDFLTTTPVKRKPHKAPHLSPPPHKVFKPTEEGLTFLSQKLASVSSMPQIPPRTFLPFDPTPDHPAVDTSVNPAPKSILTDLLPSPQEDEQYEYLGQFFTLSDLLRVEFDG